MSWDPDAEKESDSSYNGAFSYASETHAFIVGMAIGISSVMPLPKVKKFTFHLVGLDGDMARSKAMKEAKKESWYALGGMITGLFSGIFLLILLVKYGLQSLL